MTDTDAATITALLGELREVDEETFILLDDIDSMINWKAPNAHEGHRHPLDELVLHSVIQGLIQRAIAARGWDWQVQCVEAATYQAEIIAWKNRIGCPFAQDGDTPAAAILAAYVQAVRACK